MLNETAQTNARRALSDKPVNVAYANAIIALGTLERAFAYQKNRPFGSLLGLIRDEFRQARLNNDMRYCREGLDHLVELGILGRDSEFGNYFPG